MAEQNFKNHVRRDPAYLFVLAPLLLFLLFSAIWRWWHVRDFDHGWMIVAAVALFVVAGIARTYALKVQDRTIRIEEKLRLTEAGVDPKPFSLRQLIALRFASDAELAPLARRTLKEDLNGKAIKAAIQHWRADDHRV